MNVPDLLDSDSALFLHFLSIGYFYLEDYDQAWTYNNQVTEYTRDHYKVSNLFTTALIFNLVIHYELENYQLLTYQLETAVNLIKKIEGSFQWEFALIKQLKKIITYPKSDPQVGRYFTELSIVLEDLFQDPFEREANLYFDYRGWINRKKESF